MSKDKDTTRTLCEIMEKLQDGLLSDICNPLNVSYVEIGAIADMIKDLAMAKYYESIVVAMEESASDKEYGEDGMISGYRRNRMMPIDYTEPYMNNQRMGYREPITNTSRHGTSYDKFQNDRRFFTQNPTEDNKMKMNASFDDASDDAIQALKKMYMMAEPMQKRKVHEKLQRALQEMPPV